MIKFEHTVFALPFAYLGYILGSEGRIRLDHFVWVTLAMVAARTAGMCLNRIIDREIDARNPRTQSRALVTGAFSAGKAWIIAAASLVVLVISASQLNFLCLALSPAAVLLLTGYHYLKRFSVLCHLGIGTVLACAPIGGWVAATGTLDPAAILLGGAVMFWTAGFDIFYSMQDAEFDKAAGLYSIPARWGVGPAARVAAGLHILTLFFLTSLGIMLSLTAVYWIGLVLAAAILAGEHLLMRGGRLKNLNAAFFTMNGVLSSCFFVFTSISVFLR